MFPILLSKKDRADFQSHRVPLDPFAKILQKGRINSSPVCYT